MINAHWMTTVSRQVWADTATIRIESELRIEPDGQESVLFIVTDKTVWRVKRFSHMKEAITFANSPFWAD